MRMSESFNRVADVEGYDQIVVSQDKRRFAHAVSNTRNEQRPCVMDHALVRGVWQ
jgi:hypothetical protein